MNANRIFSYKTQHYSKKLGLDLPYFIKGGFWLGFSISATTLGGILLSALFTRIWPKDVYGQYSFLTALLGFMSVVSFPGMGQALVQAISEGKDGTYKYAAFKIFKWSILGTVLMVFGSGYFYFRDNPNFALAVLLASLVFPINSSLRLYSNFLNGKKDFKRISIYSTSIQLFSTGATALALWKFNSLASVAFFATWSSAIGYSIATYFSFRRIENNQIDKGLVRFGEILSIRQLMTFGVDYFDRFTIPIILGFNQNAVYAIGILIPMQLQNILKTLFTMIQPKIVKIRDKDAKSVLLKKLIQLEIPIVCIVVVYILFAPKIFSLLYPEYGEAVLISQIFSLILLFYPATLYGLYMIKKRVTKEVMISGFVYFLVSIVSLLAFINIWGLIGVAVSKIISRFVKVLTTQIIFNKAVSNSTSNSFQK